MKLWIGTSGFQYPEWKGTFYPQKMPVSKMLPYYAERFATTEVNYSFRRIPSPKTISNWANATPDYFKFTFKAPQRVTHFAKLHDCTDTMEYFCDVISALDNKLGAVLFQLPPEFEKDVGRLNDFLATLPQHLQVAFEFRNESWFDEEVYGVLHERGAALCIAESEKISTPPIVTGKFGYLRLRREDYTQDDIERWADFAASHVGDWSDLYIYFKHEESGVGPKFAQQMIDAMAEREKALTFA